MNASSGLRFWLEGDAVSLTVAWGLLAMSVLSWVLIGWKWKLLARAAWQMPRLTQAFWQATDWQQGQQQLQTHDDQAWVSPCLQAVCSPPPPATVGGQGPAELWVTRQLRDALSHARHRLHQGHVVLATIGSTAPFVGLLGTVWGVYHALHQLGDEDTQLSLAVLGGPVGEALIMTAAGLAVAIPAVVAYNLLSRRAQALEAELEAFAHDLRAATLAQREVVR